METKHNIHISGVDGKSDCIASTWESRTKLIQDGGLYCDGGKAKKPFPDQPYCVDGTGVLSAVNKCTKIISFCQTVLPGNEAMLIPTDVEAGSSAVLAVPGPSYWAGTAAQ
jgi:hypothetical protein